jgi:hypothetical protein
VEESLTPRTFRALLIAWLGLALLGAIVDTVFPGLVPEPMAKAQEAADAAWSGATLVAAIAVCAAVITATVGLYRFRPWARALALASSALGFLLAALLGATSQSGLALALLDLSSTVWGACLALAYFSPLSKRFEPAGGADAPSS